MIRAQSADGKVHEFPPGTSQAVIDRVMRDYARKGRSPGTMADMAVGFGRGLLSSGGDIVDLVTTASPAGGVLGTIQTAAKFANVFQGRPDTTITGPMTGAGATARRVAPKPVTTAGKYAEAVGQNVPAAFVPGSRMQRAANVFVPAVTGEFAAQTTEAMGGGEGAQTVARIGGNLMGAGVASLRPANVFGNEEAIARVATRSRQDPSAMRARAAEYQAAGINPTLVDVMDDSGRGIVRAAANRPTPGRQVANDFAEGRVLNLPSRMSGQARAAMSRDPRTPDAIRAAETARRTGRANQAFGAVRNEPLPMAPETVQALRTDYGRSAIAEAAKRERDPEVRAALLRLADDALDNPSTPITVGMADRISRVLLSGAEKARRDGDNDLATTLGNLGRSVREPARQASPGYGAALEGFAQDTQLIEAAGVGENLLTRNTDEFVAQAANLDPRARALAAAAGRRAIERRAGENPSTAIGVARQIAIAPEQQARTRALIGPERAQRLETGMAMEARAVRNAQDVQPRAGSSTYLNLENDQTLQQAGGVLQDVMSLNLRGLAARGVDAWRRRGLSDDQIEELIRTAIDPNQTDAAIEAIARAIGPEGARPLIELRNAALVGGAATLPALAAP